MNGGRPARPRARSRTSVVFRGGTRARVYTAMPAEGVDELVGMRDLARSAG